MKKSLSIKKILMYLVVVVLLSVIVIAMLPGETKPILDAEGNRLENSIATMEKINLGGADQWIVMRGKNKDNPVLLMLSGGPGGTEMGRFLNFNNKLENDFIVVNWEQRGSGKSYPPIKNREDMTVEQYVSDINELTNYLKKRFGKEKIYLLGHSWGTIIGTKAVQKYPEQFHAYIGAAQMVNIDKTDKYMYDYVLDKSKKYGDEKTVKTLEKNGPPPYNGEKVLNEYKVFLTNYADYYRKENSYGENLSWYNPLSFIWIPEYNIIDKVNVVRGMIDTFNIMYPQIQNVDFVKKANKFEVPVYYLIGRHDYTARFIEDYYEAVEAPQKNLYYFENSSHGEIWSEADKFYDIMTQEVLAKK